MKNIQFIVSVRATGNTCHSFHFPFARIYIKIHIYIYHGHFEEKILQSNQADFNIKAHCVNLLYSPGNFLIGDFNM